MNKNFLSPLFFFLTLVFIPGALYAKPGKEFVLKKLETTATLHLVEVHKNPTSGSFAYRFLWIPDDIVSRCLGETSDFCKNLDNCTLYPDAQKCSADWSSCEKIIRPECLPFGFTLEKLSKKQRQAPPNALLDTLHHTESDKLIASVKAMGISDFLDSKLRFNTIDIRRAVKARVHWEQWTNGENFKILEFLE